MREVVTWAVSLLCVTVFGVVELIKLGHIDVELRGMFVTLATVLLARGTDAARTAASRATDDKPPS